MLPLALVRPEGCSYSVTAVYNPKAFILHAVSLRQAFAHCGRFSTAASRRSLGRVAVPMVGVRLSPPLGVVALVSHYLTNKLIPNRPFQKRRSIYSCETIRY